MIVGYIPFALLGAVSSSALMWSHGALEAVLAAPIGGSLGAVLVAAWVLSRGLSQRFLPQQNMLSAWMHPGSMRGC